MKYHVQSQSLGNVTRECNGSHLSATPSSLAKNFPWMLLLFGAFGALSVSRPYAGQVSFVLGALALLPAIYATVRAPHMAIISCILLYVVPQYSGEDASALFHLNPLACVGLVLIAVIYHFGSTKKPFFLSGFWELISFWVVLAIGSLLNPPPLIDIGWNNVVLLLVLSVLGVETIRSRDHVLEVALAIVIAGTIVGVACLVRGLHEANIEIERFRIGDFDQNYMSYVGGMAVAGVLGILAEKRFQISRVIKMLLLCAATVVVCGVSFMGSRSFVVASAVCLGVYFLSVVKSPAKLLGGIAFLVGIIVLAFQFHFGDQWVLRFFDKSAVTGSGRSDIWMTSCEVFLSQSLWKNILGAGYMNSVELLGSVMNVGLRSAHNMYIAILLDAGVLGLIVFITFTVRVVLRGIHKVGQAPMLSMILLAYCVVQGMFLELQHMPAFWCLICVIVAGVMDDRIRDSHRTPG